MINWIQKNSQKLFNYIFFGIITAVFTYNSNHNTKVVDTMVQTTTEALIKTAEQTTARSIENQKNIASISTLLNIYVDRDVDIKSRVDTIEVKLKRNSIR